MSRVGPIYRLFARYGDLKRISYAIIGTLSLCAIPAIAQTEPSSTFSNPAEKYAVAPGGVDMRTGRYVYKKTDLAIGGDDQPSSLKLDRMLTQNVPNHANPFGNLSHNWDISITEWRITRDKGPFSTGSDFRMVVSYGGRSETFDAYSNTGYTQVSQADTASLTWTGDRTASTGLYTFTDSDGTTFEFRAIGSGDCSGTQRCADVAKVTEPDGTIYTFNYASTGVAGNGARLTSVVSSRGYAILLEGSGTLVSKACALNLSVAPLPANNLCPTGVPTTSYTYSGQLLATVTDTAHGVWNFTYGSFGANGPGTMAFLRPGESTPWLTNTLIGDADEQNIIQAVVSSQAFADGRTYAYSYNHAPGDLSPNPVVGGSYVDNTGRNVTVEYGFPAFPGTGPGELCTLPPCQPLSPSGGDNAVKYQQTSGPQTITDQLGRSTTFDYCNPQALIDLPSQDHNRCIVEVLQSYVTPDGVKTVLTYSGPRNITQVRKIAKTGSGLSDIVTSATYNDPCSNPKTCPKPLTTTDARGNVTTYTYKAENGGVLTETKPADANGIHPVTRYGYGQRSAWISNGAGGYTQGSPIWLLFTAKTCRTTATVGDACAGGTTDEVVTTYDYGPDSGPNTLLLRGKIITADGVSRRTCYLYDPQGNKISETSPRANLTACS
jgi:YD repeat-containing protein